MAKLNFIFSRGVLTFFMAALALLAINLVWLLPTLTNIRSSASLLALEILNRVHSSVTNYLDNSQLQLSFVAKDIAVEPERLKISLEVFLKNNPGFRNVALADAEGQEIFRIDRRELVREEDLQNHSLEPYFKSALEGGIAFGEVFLTPELEPHVRIAVPVGYFEKPEQVLVADLNLRVLMAAVSDVKVEGQVYIVDRSGFQVVHPEITEILRRANFADRKIIQKVVFEGQSADGLAPEDSYLNEEGIRVFAVGRPVIGAGLGIIFEQPRKLALAGQRQAYIFAITTFLLGLLIFFLILRANMRLNVLNLRLGSTLKELDRANAKLRQLDKVKSEFVSMAAHQIRTPLTGIKWSLSFLQEEADSLPIEQKKLVQDAMTETTRLTKLISDLLNVARIEEGRFGIKLLLQPITPLVNSLLRSWKLSAKNKGIEFVAEMPDVLPNLNFDEQKIMIVIENLLDNAVKYTLPGGKITFKASLDKRKAVFEVRDNGIGIPQSQQYKVFEKFFRSSNAQLFEYTGTGLGLYVSKSIVEQHGGKMRFNSEEGKGSSFYFSLPRNTTSDTLRAKRP